MDTQTFTPNPAENAARAQTFETSTRGPGAILAWTAYSHHNHERSAHWYLFGGVFVLAIAVYGIVTGAWTLTLVSLLLGGVYFLTRREMTPLKEIRIFADGIDFNGSFTAWDQCKDFWIVTTPLFTELHVTRKGAIKSNILIQTADIDPTLIRSTLSQFLPMRPDQREHMFDAIIRLCKL
ncbi:MAG: hypothetical protein HOO67_01455 [Candidatus Peribacteraceae bacterium]|nr:hypothetical protein [Candidatus Peribacteraceae bacterium]